LWFNCFLLGPLMEKCTQRNITLGDSSAFFFADCAAKKWRADARSR
jgi:hypothetical protein